MKRPLPVLPLLLLAAFAAACGGSYVPPSAPSTGQPAAPLGRAFDLSVALPYLEFPSIPARGATLAVELEVDGVGDGRHAVAVRYGKARVGGQETEVLDLSGGDALLVESDGAWLIARLGPVQVAGTAFEYRLEGRSGPDGWTVAGTSRESQTGGEGTFAGRAATASRSPAPTTPRAGRWSCSSGRRAGRWAPGSR